MRDICEIKNEVKDFVITWELCEEFLIVFTDIIILTIAGCKSKVLVILVQTNNYSDWWRTSRNDINFNN